MLDLRQEGCSVVLKVKAVPGASRTGYLGEWQGYARIAVAAAPERGKANKELTDYLAKVLSLPRSAVTVVGGLHSPRKAVKIEGTSPEAVLAAFCPGRP